MNASTESGDAGSEFARPAGHDGPFADRPGYQPQPAEVPAAQTRNGALAGSAEFAAPPSVTESFNPPPGERLPPQLRSGRQPVPAELVHAFAGASAAQVFDPPPGSRIAPELAGPGSPWWKQDAESDPWRDPQSPFWLGGPPVYVDDEVVGMAELTDEDEPAAVVPTGKSRRAKFGWSALGLVVIAALVAGAVGGGVGYLLSQRAHRILTNSHVTLSQTHSAVTRAPGSVADIAKRVAPAVVSIDVHSADEAGSGSGVVIDGNGYILTNNHVVASFGKAVTIRVIFSDHSSATGKVVGTDPVNDIAVVKVDKSSLTVATLGDSSLLAVGDPVVAIGDPLGLRGTVTSGIVSSLNRPLRLPGENGEPDAVIDAIQTDAPINPGNSGGALVDAQGAVIGINTAILSLGQSSAGGQSGNIGVGFAIPIDTASKVAESLIHTGKVSHANLGASSRSVTDGLRDGAYLVQVEPGGAADHAGLKAGDVVTQYGQTLIDSGDALAVAVAESTSGETVTLNYFRGSQQHQAIVKLGSQ